MLILDTCIIIAALRSPRGASFALLSRVGLGRFDIGLTTALVLEYEAVCRRSLDELPVTAERIDGLLGALCAVGRLAVVRFRVRPSLPDPGDEHVLEAAVATGAEWMVTHNLSDLFDGAAR